MKIQKEIALFVVGFILIGVFVAIAFPKEQKINKNAILRIGAGDDISGLLLKEIEKEIDDEYMISGNLESSSFQDC